MIALDRSGEYVIPKRRLATELFGKEESFNRLQPDRAVEVRKIPPLPREHLSGKPAERAVIVTQKRSHNG